MGLSSQSNVYASTSQIDIDSCVSSFPASASASFSLLTTPKSSTHHHTSQVELVQTERAGFARLIREKQRDEIFAPIVIRELIKEDLPVIKPTSQEPEEPLASTFDDTSTQFKRIDGTVPLGDQLGDVGQYYSQVAPSFHSSLQLLNTSPLTQSINISLYGDSGYVARLFRGCQLAPYVYYLWSVQEKQMVVTRGGDAVSIDTICEDSGLVTKNGDEVEPVLHGIYHAEIVTEGSSAINAQMINRIDRDRQIISRYPLIPKAQTSNLAHAAGVFVSRQSQNRWDTELVVQNHEDSSIQITFNICNAAGSCFNNNQAELKAKERRTFLASHLFYTDGNQEEVLIEQNGWHSVTAVASALSGQSVPRIALVSNIFKQSIFEEDTSQPQSEKGSSCLLTSSHSHGQKQLKYSTTLNRPLLLRVYNPANGRSVVKLSFIDGDNNTIRTTQYSLAAYTSVEWSADKLRQQISEQFDGRTIHLVIESQTNIDAFLWEDGVIVQPTIASPKHVAETAGANTQLSAPFWGAPTLPFQWDRAENDAIADNTTASSRADTHSEQMQSRFGLGETAPGHEKRPEWARKLNWYNWFALRESCNMPVGDNDDYSTYMALWQGLERCSDDSDRSCINSEERLLAIQNRIPSSCAGRPLFLSNEPDVNGGDFMSYAELSRLIYLFRDWPGDLYSPTFAGPQYDQAWYPSEATPWCTKAVNEGICPQSAGCEACIQDGVVDGVWDPYDIHLQGLEEFFQLPNLWVEGRSWPIETILDGLSIHFYTDYDSLANDEHWRAPLLQQYRDRANEVGWPIIVKEYGFIMWPSRSGTFIDISRCDIVDRLDNARRVLQKNLGGYAAEHNQNPFKLFWFHSSCNNPGLPFYEKLCLFETLTELSKPVGVRWYQDAVTQSDEDTSGICSEIRLPLLP